MSVEETKAVVRELVEGWRSLDRSVFMRLVSPSLQEEILAHYDEIAAAFSDLDVRIEDIVAEGDKVAARLVVRGRHDRGPFAGREPSGRRLRWESFRFYRIEDGRVAETWAMQDRLGLFQQLGVVPPLDDLVHWAAAGTD